jgi:hypothetical protein
MERVSDVPVSIELGRFGVVPHRRQLLASGAVVSKDVLIRRVWQGRIVEEKPSARPDFGAAQAFGVETAT